METTISDYLIDLRAAQRSSLTIGSYGQVLRDTCRYLATHGIEDWAKVTPPDLRCYLVALRDGGLKASTIRTRATIVSAFFNWLVEQGLTNSNPMMLVHRPRKPQARISVFTRAELLDLFTAVEHTYEPTRNRAILHLLLDCGLRASELLKLKPQDYDPATATLTISGKGRRMRVVRMGHRCQEALEAQLVAADGNLWDITRVELGKLIRRMGKRAGVRAHPHKFRHTFSYRFLDAGGTIDELQIILGHSDISTTMIYAAAGQEERALRSQVQHSPVDRLF